MRPIGGFHELELPPPHGDHLHPAGLRLNTGRGCLSLLVSHHRPTAVHLPYFACNALAQPFRDAHIPIHRYPITHDFDVPEASLRTLGTNDLLVYIDYYGLHHHHAAHLANRLGQQLVVDNTQAFFAPPSPPSASFNSARKFFGVPDGAYLFPSPSRPLPNPPPAPNPPRVDHLVGRLCGAQAQAYQAFRDAEAALDSQPFAMSRLSAHLLALVDYPEVARRRRRNFEIYANALSPLNRLTLPPPTGVPFCYPFLPDRLLDRTALAARGIFIPTLWPEVLNHPSTDAPWEHTLAAQLLPLPLDHRYDEPDILTVIKALTHDV